MRYVSTLFTTFLAALAIAGCKPDAPVPVEPEAGPACQGTSVEDGITGVEPGPFTVVFTYDQNIKCPLSEQARITIDNSAKIAKVSALNTNLTVQVTDLDYEKQYTLTIPEGAVQGFKEHQAGAKAVTFRFTTKAAPAPKPDPDVIPTPDGTLGWQVRAKLGLGINMGNQLDAFYNGTWAGDKYNYPDETCWGNAKLTQATFDAIKAAGFDSVRIPVTWLNMIGPAPDYKINEAWLARVAEVLGYAKKAGLNAIVNTHHDENNADDHWLDVAAASRNTATRDAISVKVVKFWTQVAERFKNEGDWLIFESFNEIQDGGWGHSAAFTANPKAQCDVLNEWNQKFVDAVRATGAENATRLLGVPGYAASPDFLDYFVLPKDPAGKVMVAVHFYDPFDYASGSKYTEWGHTANRDKKANWGDEDNVRSKFSALYGRFIAQGIPCYLGEYGCVNRANEHDRAFQNYYMEYVTRAARLFGLPCFLWDNGAYNGDGENFGYINHGNGSYIGEAFKTVQLMNKAAHSDDASYTLDKIYSTAP